MFTKAWFPLEIPIGNPIESTYWKFLLYFIYRSMVAEGWFRKHGYGRMVTGIRVTMLG